MLKAIIEMLTIRQSLISSVIEIRALGLVMIITLMNPYWFEAKKIALLSLVQRSLSTEDRTFSSIRQTMFPIVV